MQKQNSFYLSLIIICVFLAIYPSSDGLFAQSEISRKLSEPYQQIGRASIQNLSVPYVSIAAVGDLMMGSWVIDLMNQNGIDYPFDSTRAILASCDIGIANLEAPISATGQLFIEKSYTFKVPPRYAAGIGKSGINVVNLANNHILDFGPEALQNTINTLDDLGISHCGAGMNQAEAFAPGILKSGGKKLAFLGFSMTFPKEFWAKVDSPGTAYPTPLLFKSAIRQAKQTNDFVIASFHWGQELRNSPKDYQIVYAHQAIDAGADLVLGHHPHVLQGLEIYRNKLIAYSLGNYVFGSFSKNAKESVILQVYQGASGLVLARLIPINVHNAFVRFQPRMLRGAKRDSVLSRLNKYSRPLNNNQNIINNFGLILPSTKINNCRDTND